MNRTEQNILMRQDRSLGITRCAGRVHDKQRIGQISPRTFQRFADFKIFDIICKIRIRRVVALSQAIVAHRGDTGGLDFADFRRKFI